MIHTNPLLNQSLMNCHARGVDSLVLKGAPGMVRIFLARPDHELVDHPDKPLALGLHAHHCALTLVPLFGQITHMVSDRGGFMADLYRTATRELAAYHFMSPIHGGAGAFQRIGTTKTRFEIQLFNLDRPHSMSARMLHTIAVPMGEAAAWLVCEGKEDTGYLPITWSDADLKQFDFHGMYQPMTPGRLLENVELLAKNGVSI